MLKLVGAVCIFCALSWCGLGKAIWFRRRTDCLSAWQGGLLEAERQLCDMEVSTVVCLEVLSVNPWLQKTAQGCMNGLAREERFEQAWCAALESAGLPLRREELQNLLDLGRVLGRYDAGAQRQSLHQAQQRLNEQFAQAEEERRRLGRMWGALGVSAGVLAVAILY